jgi:hypothetical protein
MAVTINEGTQTDIYSVANAGTEIPIVKIDIGSGTATSDFGGTILAVNSVANVVKGTVTSAENIVKGTITRVEGGTLVVDNVSYRHPDEFATQVDTGTSTLGTIVAAVSGSQIFVTSMTISVGSATNVEIASGGTSTRIAGTFYFNANGGAQLEYDPPIRTVAGSALVYKQSSLISPLSITATGYID